MSKVNKKKVAWIAGLIMAVALFFLPGLKVPLIDASADRYFADSITKAGLAYATCRLVNATISIIKDSNVQLQPAGVGITLAVGQIVDPIDDATERLSDVLVTVIVSLGIEKLLYEISVSVVPPLISLILLSLLILALLHHRRWEKPRKILLRVLLLVIFARFALPVSSLINQFVHQGFFEQKIQSAKDKLSLGSAELEKLKDLSMPEVAGFLGTVKNNAFFLARKTIEFRNALVYTVKNVGTIIDSIINLLLLYLGVFVLQVILLPLLMFWILIKLTNSLFEADLPVLIRHPGRGKGKEPVARSSGES